VHNDGARLTTLACAIGKHASAANNSRQKHLRGRAGKRALRARERASARAGKGEDEAGAEVAQGRNAIFSPHHAPFRARADATLRPRRLDRTRGWLLYFFLSLSLFSSFFLFSQRENARDYKASAEKSLPVK